ncbi:hypothetical protein M8J76_002902 [Diaphorina citri]|nr:hypothetical protein M8J76_002902 [Diaphorina citri]
MSKLLKVNNATARVQTKKPIVPALPNVCVQWPTAEAALRGVAIQRSRVAAVRAGFPVNSAAFAPPNPLQALAASAALPYAPSVYYDPFLVAQAQAAQAAQADNNYRLQPVTASPVEVASAVAAQAQAVQQAQAQAVQQAQAQAVQQAAAAQQAAVAQNSPLLKAAAAANNPAAVLAAGAPGANQVLAGVNVSAAQQASYAAAASYTAAAARAYNTAVAAAQQAGGPTAAVAGYAALPAGYAREYADPYLGATGSIGPLPTYGVYRGYAGNRFAPY